MLVVVTGEVSEYITCLSILNIESQYEANPIQTFVHRFQEEYRCSSSSSSVENGKPETKIGR